MEGWAADLVLWDLMHNLYIGVGRDFCGSAIVLLCIVGYFGLSANMEDRLTRAHQCFREFSRRVRLDSTCPVFTTNNVHMHRNTYPELDVKAAHVKDVLLWLGSEMPLAALIQPRGPAGGGNCAYALASLIRTLSMQTRSSMQRCRVRWEFRLGARCAEPIAAYTY